MTSMDAIALDEVVSSLPNGPQFTAALSIPETADEVLALTVQIGEAVGQPRVRPW